jgi:site-specific recombinase XerC
MCVGRRFVMPAYASAVRRPPRTLTDLDRARVLKTTGEHRHGFRDHVILSFALGTALRQHEIAALDVGDVVTSAGRVRRCIALRVFKRSAAEPAPQDAFLPDGTFYKLTKFLAWKRSNGESLAADAPLFMSSRGKRIATRTLRHMFKVWQIRAGVDRVQNFHALRHSALSDAYHRERDILVVQRIARHKDVSTTMIYTAPSDQDIMDAVRDQIC